MMEVFRYDFDYTWPWTYGHVLAAAVFAAAAAAAFTSRRRWLGAAAGVLALWAVAGAATVHTALRFTRPLAMPTARFLESGTGSVLDAGAGSGRSALMVLQSRPGARVTALDLFSGYYGIGDNSPERLRANARAAGVEPRLDVKVGDMRHMPFPDAAFDAAVSAFAIDHLAREGVEQSFAELSRVVRPGGDFLLMVVNPDGWVRVAFPFLVHHGYFGGRANPDRWRRQLAAAGFEVVEQGTAPATLYLLARNARD